VDQLGEGFRRLQTRLRRNRLIQEVSRQRRHEKKGVKRRRLSSERWRRMFANEVFIFFLALLSGLCSCLCRCGRKCNLLALYVVVEPTKTPTPPLIRATSVPGVFIYFSCGFFPRGTLACKLHTLPTCFWYYNDSSFMKRRPKPTFGAWRFVRYPILAFFSPLV
jgi:hypothetical protein